MTTALLAGTVVEKIADVFIQEVDLLKGIEGQVEWIEKELRLMCASLILVEAMEKPGQDAEKWAKEAGNVVREVEDLIDEFLNRSLQNRRSRWPKIKSLDLIHRHKIGMKLEQIKVQIRKLSKTRSRKQEGIMSQASFSQSQASSNARDTVASVMRKVNVVLSDNLLVIDALTEHVENIRDQFVGLQGIMNDLEEAEELDERSKAWIDEVKDVSDSANKTLGSFVSERQNQLLGAFKMPSLFLKDLKLRWAMERISISIQNLYDMKWRYNIGDDYEGRERKQTSMVLKRSAVRGTSTIFSFLLLSNPFFMPAVLFWLEYYMLEMILAQYHRVDDPLKLINKDLKLMQALIKDVDDKAGLDQRVCVWVEEIEDIVQRHGNNLPNDPAQNRPRRILKRTLFVFREVFARPMIWKKIKQINSRIREASERKWTYDIGKIEGRKRSRSNHQIQHQEESSNSDAAGHHNMGSSEEALQGKPTRSTTRSTLLSVMELWLTVLLPNFHSYKELQQRVESMKWELKLMDALFMDVGPIEDHDERVQIWVAKMQAVANDASKLIKSYDNVEKKMRGTSVKYLFTRYKMAKEIERLENGICDISRIKGTYAIGGIEGRKGHSTADHETQQETASSTSEITEAPNISNLEGAPPVFFSQMIKIRPEAKVILSLMSVQNLEEIVALIETEQSLMHALIKDVGGMDRLDGIQKVWVEQMRAVADDVDAIIKKYKGITEQKGWKIGERHEVARKMELVMRKIRDMSERRMAYGIDHIKGSAELNIDYKKRRAKPTIMVNQTLPHSFVIQEPGIINLYDDLQAVMTRLLADNEDGCIISIVGMRGIGKTTLAELICNHDAVKCRFPRRLWVSIHSKSDSNASRIPLDLQVMELQEWKGKEMLSALLAVNPSLLVIDNVSTKEVWNEVKKSIPKTMNGIRIVLTTRELEVAKHADPTSVPHKLNLLSDDDSWALFKHSLTLPTEPKVLKKSRKNLIQCGGLPETIVHLRKQFLKVESTSKEWLGLLEKLKLNQDPWQEASEVITWGDFPLYLRNCMFYIRQFPMGFEIPVRRLIALWIAEGVLRQRGSAKDAPESVANVYLTELIGRNMVQVTKKKLNGEVKKCRIPHPLQKMLERTSKTSHLVDYYNPSDASFSHIHGDDITSTSTSLLSGYKDVISFTSFDAREGSKPGEDLGKFLNRCISSRCFLSLRVLDLERVFRPELPKALGRLVRLRYLGLRWTYLETLPPFISKLLNLQILDVKHTSISTLPRSIWKMHQLRHLYLNESYCCRLASPPSANSLTNLQTLWGVFIDEHSPVKDGLNKLLNLKRLGLASRLMASQREGVRTGVEASPAKELSKLENEMLSKLEAVADWVNELKQLQSLRLKSCDELNRPWNLPLRPLSGHTNLSTIYLLGKIEDHFVQSGLPQGLTDLTLSGSGLVDDPMPTLEKLPSLKILRLLGDSFIGTQMLCSSGGFLQLRVLKLWKLNQLEKWEVQQGALPNLLDLEIRVCNQNMPTIIGLQFLRSIKLTDEIMVKMNTSTCQNPSNFDSTQDSYSRVASKCEKPLSTPKEKVHQAASAQPIPYIDSFPNKLIPYIAVSDVVADGNCGFRAIADLMGMGENSWVQIREDLIRELNSNRDYYNILYGQVDADELLRSLSGMESSSNHDNWMIMPDTGHLISSCYKVVLLLISKPLCVTFLPLRSKPDHLHRVIAIGYVNNNHFVEVFMSPDSPVPPIHPKWDGHRHTCAYGWQTPYISRIEVFKQLMGDDVVTRETVPKDEKVSLEQTIEVAIERVEQVGDSVSMENVAAQMLEPSEDISVDAGEVPVSSIALDSSEAAGERSGPSQEEPFLENVDEETLLPQNLSLQDPPRGNHEQL